MHRVVKQFYDVIVVGFGFAGGAAAVAAADAGASVLLLEKMPDPGGISITAGGGVRVCPDAQTAFTYIQAINGGRTPDANITPIAEGMAWLPEWFSYLAKHCGAVISVADAPGNYPFSGFDKLQMLNVVEIPDFDPQAEYPHARALRGGTRAGRGGAPASATGGGIGVFKVVHEAVKARPSIEVRLDAPVRRLLTDGRAATGVVVDIHGSESVEVGVRGGVILACGGFESSPELMRQYWQIDPVLSSASRGNTGDGIRMAQALGADLWHMWHFHGTYGFRHPRHPEIGIRMKRLPDWRPEGYGVPSDAETRAAKMAWILVDQSGRRFMNEYAPYVQDTGHREMEPYDPTILRFPRVPCWAVFDEEARMLYPMGGPVLNDRDPDVHYDWSDDNLAEVDNGLLKRVERIADLAAIIGVERDVLEATIAAWNVLVDSGGPDRYRRPAATRCAVRTPPFYVGEIWPVVSNTQGGPRHDPLQQVLNPFNETIAGLYVAGELGSIWGYLYTAGCNLTECFVTGRISGEHAAARAAED